MSTKELVKLSTILAIPSTYTDAAGKLWFVLKGHNADNTIRLVSRKVKSTHFSNWPKNTVRVDGQDYLVDDSGLCPFWFLENFERSLQGLRKEALENPTYITAARLKFLNETNGNGKWFSRDSMSFFGDTLSNFDVVREQRFDSYTNTVQDVYSVYRKRTTRKGAPCGYLTSFSLDGSYCHGRLDAQVGA